jgi:transposase-like protein
MAGKTKIKCEFCSSKNIIKKGIRKNKNQEVQIYQCKNCNKRFTTSTTKNKTYPSKIILNSISYYNLGHSQNKVSKMISSKFKIKVPQRTISQWINEYKTICTFNKLRKEAQKLYPPEEIIEQHTLMHNNLPYKFQIHKAKLYLLFHNIKYKNQFHNTSRFYEPLKQYLEKIPTKKFPHHIFTYDKRANENASRPNAAVANENNNATSVAEHSNEQRASQLKFKYLKIKTLSKTNQANQLTKLAINLATTNKDRHQKIQDFFLINDSTTIATEVPIYLTNWDAGYYRNEKGFIFPLNNYKTPITGHIDILQIRNGLIHILDYKPEAEKQNPIEQLTIYAMALSRKLNLPLYYFKVAWFDENNYYEFFPLHTVYEKN